MDTEILTNIGLTEGESKVYLALLRIGSSTTGPIVDKAKVSRSKIYHILERLIEKGLVTSIIKSKIRYFHAADPQKILTYIDSQKKELNENKEYVSAMLPELETYQAMNTKEEAEIYKGIEGIKTARELVLKTLKKGDTFLCFGANKMNLEPLEAYYADFHRRRAKAGIKAKYIVQADSRKKMSKKQSYGTALIDFRYLDVPGPVHIDIFGDYVITCIIKGGYTSFLIKNKFVADYYRNYFNNAWAIAKR